MSSLRRVCLDLRPAQKASRLAGTGVYAARLGQTLQQAAPGLDLRFLVLRGYPLPWPIDASALLTLSRPRRPESIQEALDPLDLPGLLRRNGVSLLHSMVPGLLTPRSGLEVVVTVHDLIPDLLPEDFRASPLAQWIHRRKMACAMRASHVLADSEATRTDLNRHRGLPLERCTTVYLGADLAPWASGEGESRPWPRPFLLYLGGFSHRKNVPLVVQAFAAVAADHPGVDLVLAGSPPAAVAEELRDLADRLGVGKRVGWMGHVPASDLPALYGACEAFVYPSLYEGFGLPVLEAMQAGAPVIASDRGSIPEVLGDAGLKVDPASREQLAEAMRRVLSDAALRARLRRDGKAQAARFSWSRCAEQTLAVYEKVLAR